MPLEATTLCFHTRDAVARDDSKLTFELAGQRLRSEAVKVALASCEFPMVQWTIEEDWARFYVNEGVRVEGEAMRCLRVIVQPPGAAEPDHPVEIVLPLRLNRPSKATPSPLGCQSGNPFGDVEDIDEASLTVAT